MKRGILRGHEKFSSGYGKVRDYSGRVKGKVGGEMVGFREDLSESAFDLGKDVESQFGEIGFGKRKRKGTVFDL